MDEDVSTPELQDEELSPEVVVILNRFRKEDVTEFRKTYVNLAKAVDKVKKDGNDGADEMQALYTLGPIINEVIDIQGMMPDETLVGIVEDSEDALFAATATIKSRIEKIKQILADIERQLESGALSPEREQELEGMKANYTLLMNSLAAQLSALKMRHENIKETKRLEEEQASAEKQQDKSDDDPSSDSIVSLDAKRNEKEARKLEEKSKKGPDEDEIGYAG